MLWASLFCTACSLDGLTTVYFINNEVDLAVNEIMHQLQYQTDQIISINYRSSAVNQGSVNYFLQFLQHHARVQVSSWYHCLQPPLHHTILSEAAFEPVKRQ